MLNRVPTLLAPLIEYGYICHSLSWLQLSIAASTKTLYLLLMLMMLDLLLMLMPELISLPAVVNYGHAGTAIAVPSQVICQYCPMLAAVGAMVIVFRTIFRFWTMWQVKALSFEQEEKYGERLSSTTPATCCSALHAHLPENI